MIKQQTVLMATPIALLATEKGIDLHDKANDIIKGLDETTANIVSFTEDNIAVELPEYTALVPEHGEVLEATATIVADTIRGSLEAISKIIKPILVETETRLKDSITPDSAVECILDQISLEMVNVEPGFLASVYYPQAPADSLKAIQTIGLGSLFQGNYPQMSGQELLDLIAIDVPDLQPFFANAKEVEDIYKSLFVEKYYYTLFNNDAIKDGVLNIASPLNYRFDSFRTLVIGSLLLNKLVTMDDPLDGVTGVSLDDYRASLRMTRDLFTTMLWNFKQIWEQRAAAGIVVIDNEIRYQPGNGPTGDLAMLQGKLVIGYNNAVLTMFADSDQLSLSEYVLGFIYAKFRDYRVKDIITDKEIVVDAWKEYQSDVTAALVLNKSANAVKIFSTVLDSLSGKEEYLPIIETMEDNIPLSQRVMSRVNALADIKLFFSNTGLLDAILRGNNRLMNTQLAVVLAEVFDFPIAREILLHNASQPAGTLEQQRKHLSRAIDSVIISRLLKL